MKHLFCFFILLLTTLSVFAEEDCDTPTLKGTKDLIKVAKMAAKEAKCPNDKGLNVLCSSVNLLKEDPNANSDYVYEYERIILEASCANLNSDSDAVISKKVNTMWNKYQANLQCDNIVGFDVHSGSILKLAVRNKFKDFLVEAAEVWKVNLNKVDESDSRTLLDYVQKEIKLNKGTADEEILQNYYNILRKAGAKLKSEL